MNDIPEENDWRMAQKDLEIAAFEKYHDVVACKSAYVPIKRVLDIIISVVLLIMMFPIMIATAVLVRLSSPGPILYRAQRYGRAGRPFVMLKFRSMFVADEKDDRDFRRQVSNEGVVAKSAADPRITPIGRWMRRLSIDELPQLINVLRGDMSLVGPRPVLPEMLHRYPLFNRTRSLVRPGLGGLWQVRDRASATHVAFMWQHDLEYLSKMSLLYDLGILLRTALVTLKRTGAT